MVVVRIWEGLGNQLFQYAYARALVERGLDVRIDLEKLFDNKFEKYYGNDIRNNILCRFNISIESLDNVITDAKLVSDRLILETQKGVENIELFLYEEKKQCFQQESYYMLDNRYVKGWFQSQKYFENIRRILLAELTLKTKIELPELLNELISSSNSVSVHIRRGDYVKINHALNKYYYKKAMKKANSIIDKPIFIVFSDNIEWARRNINLELPVYFIDDFGEFDECESLMLMSYCSHNIISNSTFSWWGAWLNQNLEKIVFAPNEKTWFENQNGIVPENWKIV